jgi:hypothetical protein
VAQEPLAGSGNASIVEDPLLGWVFVARAQLPEFSVDRFGLHVQTIKAVKNLIMACFGVLL